MIEYGLLARGEDHGLAAEGRAIHSALSKVWGLEAENRTQSTSGKGS
jgi:cytochrome c biogenesis protein